MTENPYANTQSDSGSVLSEATSTHPMQPLRGVGGWLVFLGWIWIIFGAFYCLTIVGIIIGWLPIWMGVLMRRSGGQLEQGFLQGNNGILLLASRDLATVIKIIAIATVVSLILSLPFFGFILVAAIFG